MKSEPVVTIPAALALFANAVLGLLVKVDVIPGDVVAEITAVVNGLVVLIGLLLARSRVTPVHRVFRPTQFAREETFARMAQGPKIPAARKPRPRPKA